MEASGATSQGPVATQLDTPGYIADCRRGGLAPRTGAEDRRPAMGVPKWYLYI